jgi:hypothetical protein
VRRDIMNIDFSRILPNRGLSNIDAKSGGEVVKEAENSIKPLFADSLTIQKREDLKIGDMNEIDFDELEKELVRDDRLGKLFSSQFNYEPPETPVFV